MAEMEEGEGPGERVWLSSMRERVSLLGSEFKTKSRVSRGTSVVVEVPLPERPLRRKRRNNQHNTVKLRRPNVAVPLLRDDGVTTACLAPTDLAQVARRLRIPVLGAFEAVEYGAQGSITGGFIFLYAAGLAG